MLDKVEDTKALKLADFEVSYAREPFLGEEMSDWERFKYLSDLHGKELRNLETDLDLNQYSKLQNEGRLVYVTARLWDRMLIGYSSHFWHRDLHFNVRVAQDDAWYVMPEFRKQGIGRKLREFALEELKKDDVKYAYGRLKTAHPHDESMTYLGYKLWEQVFIRKI